MAPPELLFSSYRAEASVDICLQQHHISGIGIPAKVVVAQVAENLGLKPLALLIVLMVGFLGHEQPLLSLADWSGVGFTMDAASRSVVLHLAGIRPTGTLAHFTGGSDDCSFIVQIVMETQAAFWALAFRLRSLRRTQYLSRQPSGRINPSYACCSTVSKRMMAQSILKEQLNFIQRSKPIQLIRRSKKRRLATQIHSHSHDPKVLLEVSTSHPMIMGLDWWLNVGVHQRQGLVVFVNL
ncbi:hypothetical protein B0H19DRAFT_1056214 [Mycena capillaripes]|nr:hypothetical protein B0H19DRAFT_1056214 [Mycena capillaripes]